VQQLPLLLQQNEQQQQQQQQAATPSVIETAESRRLESQLQE
jgi:hypothetical protein